MISLFKKPTKNSLIMSVNKISIPYPKIVEALGPPHETEYNEALGYDVKATWKLSFLGENFRIIYDSFDWTSNYLEKNKINNIKLFPLEKNTYGKMLGSDGLTKCFVYPILQIETGRYDVAYHYPIQFIFEKL